MNKKIIVSLTLVALLVPLLVSLAPVNAWSYPDCTEDTKYEKFGPRADQMLIKLYTDDIAEFTAFEAGEFDVIDFPLEKSYVEKWSAPPYNESIKVLPYGPELGMYLCDINNNPNDKRGCPPGYDAAGNPLIDEVNPMYPNPTGIIDVREAILRCMDQDYVADVVMGGYASPMYTPVPTAMPNYVHPEIRPGGAREDLCHVYDIDEAKAILDAAGIVDTDADGWRNYPVSLGGDGSNMIIVYYIRSDHAPRRTFGLWHADQIELAGLKVDRKLLDSAGCWVPVMLEHDFNLYTGGWGLGVDPDHLVLYQYTSFGECGYYWFPGFCYNYGACNCPEFDAWVDTLLEANTFDQAKIASRKAVEAIMDPDKEGGCAVCHVICMKGFKAHQRRYIGGTAEEEAAGYTGQLWKGIINVPAYGCDQDFWNMYPEGHLVGDGAHMTIRWGFKVPDLKKLNMIYAEWLWDHNVLGLIYDSLLTRDDYTFEWIPNLAKAYEVGTWIDPTTGVEKSKVKITLRSDIYWHDGVPVSAADVIWSFIEEPAALRAAGLSPPWGSESLAYIQSFSLLDPCNIEILLELKSVWAVGWIGGYTLHPKHIWKPLIDSYVATGDPDITGFSPDPDMIGCDNMRLEEYVGGAGGHILLVKTTQGGTVNADLENELGPSKPVQMPEPVYRECPVHANVHTLKEYLYVGGAAPEPPYISSQWHQVKGPEICTEWHLEDWIDNDDGVLSQCDKILLAKKPELEEKHWEHVYYFDPGTGQLWTDWYSQIVEPDTPVAFGASLHNQWLNPVPNTATGEDTGNLIVNKYVYIDYYDGTREYLVYDETVELPACLHHKEIFNLEFAKCFHSITIAAHIKGPDTVWVTKEDGMIEVPNPWICNWQNYTWYFWSTIKEDIAGSFFDTWHGKDYIPPGGDVGYFVPMEVPCPDCKVDLKDVFLAALAFGSFPGHSKWNSVADIVVDYKVDLKDYFAIVKKFGFA